MASYIYEQYLPESMLRLYPYGLATGGDLTLFQGEDYDAYPTLYGCNAPLIWTPGCGYEPYNVGFGWNLFGAIGNFVSNVVKTAGKAIGAVVHTIQDAAGAVGKAIAKIPIVGGVLSTVFDVVYHAATGIVNLAVAVVIEGKRIDQAVLGQLKTALQDFKQIAPYAQMVISIVPGIGSGVSAALSAGLALAEGQSIGEALKAGLIGAIPGGPLVKAVVTMGVETIQHVARGEKVDFATLTQTAGGIASSALGLPIAAKNAIMAGISTMGKVVQGQPLDKAVTDGAIMALPVNNQIKGAMTDATAMALDLAHGQKLDRVLLTKADGIISRLPTGNPLKDTLQTGIAATKKVAQGRKVEDIMFASLQSGIGDSLVSMGATKLPSEAQKAIKSGVALGSGIVNQGHRALQLTDKIQGKLAQGGIQLAKAHPMFAEARKIAASKGGTHGFDVGAGLIEQRAKVFDIATVRNSLKNVNDKLGFDIACSARIGAVANPKPKTASAAAHAGHAITMGMQSYDPKKKQIMMATIETVPSATVGAKVAVKRIAAVRASPVKKFMQKVVAG